MRSEWIANYENEEIKITTNWFTGKKLYISNELQDEHFSLFAPSMITGIFTTQKGHKLAVKSNVSGFFKANCDLLIDNKKVELKKIK